MFLERLCYVCSINLAQVLIRSTWVAPYSKILLVNRPVGQRCRKTVSILWLEGLSLNHWLLPLNHFVGPSNSSSDLSLGNFTHYIPSGPLTFNIPRSRHHMITSEHLFNRAKPGLSKKTKSTWDDLKKYLKKTWKVLDLTLTWLNLKKKILSL